MSASNQLEVAALAAAAAKEEEEAGQAGLAPRPVSRAPPSQDASEDEDASEDDDDDRPQHLRHNDGEWDEWDEGNDAGGDGGDDDDDDESDRTRALLDPPGAPLLPSPRAAFARDARSHGFDFRAWRRRCGLDQYGAIRAVNWARRCAERGEDPRPAFRAYEEAAVAAAAAGAAAAKGAAAGGSAAVPAAPWAGDEFLVPVVPDDPLVTYDYEEEDEDEDQEEDGEADARPAAATAAAAAGPSGGDGGKEQQQQQHQQQHQQQQRLIRRLADENAALHTRLQALMEATVPAELRAECGLIGGKGEEGERQQQRPSQQKQQRAPTASSANAAATAATAAIDAAYFDSYSHFDIHREMLSDAPRTEAYRHALERNPSLVRGARVVDVGAGTGVLSLFAARGGARAVTGVEGSARMARVARAVAAANGMSVEQGGPVTIVSGRVEALVEEGRAAVAAAVAVAAAAGATTPAAAGTDADAPAPPSLLATNSADVIVSEWMGYALLFESMLSSVLTARDAWLRPGGAVLPDVARVLVAGADLRAALGCAFWDDVQGLRMGPIGDEVVAGVVGGPSPLALGGRKGEEGAAAGGCAAAAAAVAVAAAAAPRRRPRLLVRQVPASALRTAPALAREMDLATMAHDDQDFTAEFECAAAANGAGAAAAAGAPDSAAATATDGATANPTTTTVSCLVLWFDTLFTERFCPDHPFVLSTAPTAQPTHWAQAVLPLSRPVELAAGGAGAGASPSGSFRGRLSMARRAGRHRALDISLEYWPAGAGGASVVDLYSMGVNQDADEFEGEGEDAPRPEATVA